MPAAVPAAVALAALATTPCTAIVPDTVLAAVALAALATAPAWAWVPATALATVALAALETEAPEPTVAPKNAASATVLMLSPLRCPCASARRPARAARLKRCGYGYGMLLASGGVTALANSAMPHA